jgi:hypothetical protein
MSASHSSATAAPGSALDRWVSFAPALYATTLFASALLLFAVQPMFTKMVLPRLGGTPAVWSIAMVFFQAALLLGYFYAHLLATRLAPVTAAFVHLGLLVAAAASLPIGIPAGFGAPPATGTALWLIALFTASLGLPFVALAATAPLLQSWFAASGHRLAGNPYVLYAASNLGSFAALLAYPFVVEPLLPLRDQARLWSFGYAALALLVAAAGLIVARGTSTRRPPAASHLSRPAFVERLKWMALAAIPSGLVIGVTAHISTDVAAAPFLWVFPLALYLLTFVAVFRDRPWIRHETAAWLVPFLVAPLAISILGADRSFWAAVIGLNLLGFFLLALVCHGELYRRRPPATRLTEFYLLVSLGGVIGGVFAGLVAPNVFPGTYEYPILIIAALFALPATASCGWRTFIRDAAPILLVAAVIAIAGIGLGFRLPADGSILLQLGLIGLVALMIISRARPGRMIPLAALAFLATELWSRPGFARVETARSFFGVHKVLDSTDGRFRVLFHGTTIHGAERLREADGTPVTGRPTPLTYYYFGGPISQAIGAARAAQGELRRVAVVGLGTASLACHRREGEHWTFFEIDPEVVRIARDPRLFRFLSGCAPTAPIVIGDARLTLAGWSKQFDLIVLDAFSSDAIPVHLLTREAFAEYAARLSPRGMIVAHISNRYVELTRPLAAVAAASGFLAAVKEERSELGVEFASNSTAAALVRRDSDFGDLVARKGWRRLNPDPSVTAWTDDYSDILAAIVRKRLGR